MNAASTSAHRLADSALGLYAAVADGDLEQARSLLTDDVILHVPGNHPLSGAHHGIHAFFRFLEASRALTDTGETIEVIDVLEGSGHVGVLCRVTATRRGRAALDNRTVHVLRVSGGRVAEAWFHNHDDLLVNEFWS